MVVAACVGWTVAADKSIKNGQGVCVVATRRQTGNEVATEKSGSKEVGGGGLVQTPALLITFPHLPVATLLGTVKIPSFCGTAVSAWQYSKKISIQWSLVGRIAVAAFLAAMAGSYLVSMLSNAVLKPVIFIILVGVAVYSFAKKSLGAHSFHVANRAALLRGVSAGLVIGFYDGFIGPGTGSFLVLAFISLLGFSFMQASAHAKVVNLATNLASILYFSFSGHILFQLALSMAAFNMAGGWVGTKLALKKGNHFIRIFFLAVVAATLLRFGWDIFFAR